MQKDSELRKLPKFHPDGDFHDWRKRVAEWVATMKKANDHGEDRSIRTRFQLLGRILYQEALPDAQKSLVDDAINKKQLNLFSNEDPVKLVLKIVNVVAIDPPMAQVTRLITSYQNVMNCTRKNKERLSMFASRFRGLAGKLLRHIQSSSTSQAGEVLAITLLHNAKLDDVTLTNAKIQLVNLAKEREMNEGNLEKSVTVEQLKDLFHESKTLELYCTHAKEYKQSNEKNPPNFSGTVFHHSERISKLLQDVKSPDENNDEEPPIEEMFKEKGSRIRLRLDDAVTVLRNISSGVSNKQLYSLGDIDEMLEERLKSHLAKQAGGSVTPKNTENNRDSGKEKADNRSNNKREAKRGRKDHNDRSEKQASKRKKVTEIVPEAADRCHDCGAEGNFRGDPSCPRKSWISNKILEKEAQKKGNGSSFFRPGSGSGGNRA